MKTRQLRKALTEEELKEFKEIFDLVDTDGGGSIQKEELRQLMETLGLNPTDEQLDEMMLEVDADGSGDIDFSEFVTVMSRTVDATYTKEELVRAFKLFESEEYGSGIVKADVLEKALVTYGENISLDKAAELLSIVDPDNSGKINYMEYINMMMNNE
ncbi:hypothetical protein FDP41_006529 [Naegleria fowleri]|uniref:EF-hand domain-containing protein n=1 Tax=Naegleria fowleri TaxID=5763 RepID=A0A6A5BBM1_NAEFO|nr:uncharacterized protein FDP41_006529 [Naegleria fowleri]KAF0974497.1 hypothetical protein FDP41_006529 [Naegleria fowleri]CAG4716990.1 unnamed protein product [Naegleria fowleri]